MTRRKPPHRIHYDGTTSPARRRRPSRQLPATTVAARVWPRARSASPQREHEQLGVARPPVGAPSRRDAEADRQHDHPTLRRA
jgi:hypothetical protein